MKTLTKFMRNMGIIVIVLLAVTIFNPLVVTLFSSERWSG